MKFFKTIFSIFKKEFWVGSFPNMYHPECFLCKLGNESCSACEFRSWGEKPGHVFENDKWVKVEY